MSIGPKKPAPAGPTIGGVAGIGKQKTLSRPKSAQRPTIVHAHHTGPSATGLGEGREPKSSEEIAKLAAEADAKAKAEADAKAEALKNETPEQKAAREKLEAEAQAKAKLVPDKYTLKAPEGMIKFLDYVKEHDPDLYFSKVCMKSADINKYYELKLEEAVALGKDDVEIPGVGGISFRETLSFTKG